MQTKGFFIAFLCFVLLLSANEAQREYPCYFMTDKPLLDGLEDKVWKTIPEATGFYTLGGEKYALEKQTYFRIGWREDALYLLIKCEESDINNISAKLKDGEDLFKEDSIELFFYPESAPYYFHLAVNPKGSRWNQIDASGQPGIPWDWQVKTHIGEDCWSAEIRIPFEVLGRNPREGETWLINIARNIYTGPIAEHFTCWPPLRAGFHEVRNFAKLVFKREVCTEVEKLEEELNRSFCDFLKGKITEINEELKRKAPMYEESINYGLQNEKFKNEAVYLKEAWQNLKLLIEEKKPSLKFLRAFLLRYPSLPQRFSEFNYKVLMEKLFE